MYFYFAPFYKVAGILWIKIAGCVLILASLVVVTMAQYHMSSSWRVGIDYHNKTDLVTTGVFGISRNPIFLSLHIALIGLWLLTPNWLMTLVLCTVLLCIHIQVRLEEEFLLKMYNGAYQQYAKKVRRWI